MPLPGLEILFYSLSNVYKDTDDAFVSVIHWKIVSNGFKCKGKGEKASGSFEKKTELLPAGWNNDGDVYILRYHHTAGNQPFVLKIIKIDESLMIHFMREEDEKVASMTVRSSDYCTGNMDNYESAFKDLEEFKKKFKKEILDEFKTDGKTSESKKKESHKQKSRLLDDNPSRSGGPSHHRPGHQPDWVDPNGPFSIGHGDLDPFGGGMGGGMLMDPRRSGPGFGLDPSSGLSARLPRGAVPPGARFDPFAPPGSRPGPYPDHMRPPDYDDMFM